MFFYYFPSTGSFKRTSYFHGNDLLNTVARDITQIYNFLISSEIFIEKKYTVQSMIEILKIVFNEEIGFTSGDTDYIFLPLDFKLISQKRDFIEAQLDALGYIRKFTAKDKIHVENAFRIELVSQIMNSEVLSFKTGMYLLYNLAHLNEYSDLFFIEVNTGPVLKLNPIYKGFGAFLNDRDLLSETTRFEILQKVQSFLIENHPSLIKANIDANLANQQFNDIINKMNRLHLAETRYYKGEI